MNIAADTSSVAVLWFGARRPPGVLRDLPTLRAEGPADTAAVDAAIGPYRRLVVVGTDADLAAVLSRMLRAERLDVEVAFVPPRRTRAARIYRLPAGRRAARRSRRGTAQRVTLVRDETGAVIVGRAGWAPPEDAQLLRGEAVVDDTQLFDGQVTGAAVEPTLAMPGLRASVHRTRRRWIAGRAVQLGSTGVAVIRDGVRAPRSARRSTFYRHIEGWLLVR
ncbi:peptidase M50 [Mycobacterium sp. 1100029.7]|nr:peptidase M50 [Mycobacterium sp. 1100029.7]